MTSTQAVGAVRRPSTRTRPATPARSIRWQPAFCRSRSAKRRRPCSFAVDGEKAYRFTVRWGGETDTDDAEGTVTNTSDKRPERGDIEALLPRFHGEIMQVPPAYSAIKVDGDTRL